MKKHLPLFKQIFFFGIVGVVTLGIDVGVTYLCFNVLHLPAYLSSAIGFLSGFFFNFPMNRKRVFRHSSRDRFSFRWQIIFYIALSIFNLVTTSALVSFIVYIGIDIAIAKILVTILIAIWNFLLFKLFIFSKTPQLKSE